MHHKLLQYVAVTFGCVLISCAINLFFVPHHLLSHGLTGIATILYYRFGWSIGLQLLVMNLPILYVAYRCIGKAYVLATIYGTIILSVAIDATRFLVYLNVVDDPMISAIAGGVVTGLGAGLIFRVNGSAGGLDTIAFMLKKYYSLNVGSTGFAVNVAIMLSSAILFGLKLAILTLVAMFIAATVTNKVVNGFNNKKSIYIISYNTEIIVNSILSEIGRGVTILYGEGAYTKRKKEVIFVVVNLTQVPKIKQLVHAGDPHAFMIVSDATEVLGLGFTTTQ